MPKHKLKKSTQNIQDKILKIYKTKVRKTMETRRQEKIAENLSKGWEALKKGNTKAGLSLYLHALTVYKGSFKAVKIELITAKRKGFLPKEFMIPKNARQFKNILKKF